MFRIYANSTKRFLQATPTLNLQLNDHFDPGLKQMSLSSLRPQFALSKINRCFSFSFESPARPILLFVKSDHWLDSTQLILWITEICLFLWEIFSFKVLLFVTEWKDWLLAGKLSKRAEMSGSSGRWYGLQSTGHSWGGLLVIWFNHAAASHAQVVRTMNSHRCVGFKHWHGLMTSILLKFQHEVGFWIQKSGKIYSEKYSKKYLKSTHT